MDAKLRVLSKLEVDDRMKEKFIECVKATKEHFKGKQVTPVGYFKHLGEEMRERNLHKAADKLDIMLKQKIREGVFSP